MPYANAIYPEDAEVSICNDCIKNADCCIGLEKFENRS